MRKGIEHGCCKKTLGQERRGATQSRHRVLRELPACRCRRPQQCYPQLQLYDDAPRAPSLRERTTALREEAAAQLRFYGVSPPQQPFGSLALLHNGVDQVVDDYITSQRDLLGAMIEPAAIALTFAAHTLFAVCPVVRHLTQAELVESWLLSCGGLMLPDLDDDSAAQVFFALTPNAVR